jgi:CheY-like chemotaxis protein/Tfp pilus assembly protein PilZ
MTTRKKTIVLADDSEAVVMHLSILLKRLGFDVLPVENGLEALKLIKVMEPDLILLDINMPVMDGVTALRMIKGDKRILEIPVIMLTIETSKGIIEDCKKLGCSGYITKPVKIEKVHEVLQKYLYTTTKLKRKYIRVPFNKRVSVVYKGKTHKLYALNLSEGGIYITSKDAFPIHSKVQIILDLDNKKSISLEAEVVHVKGLYGELFKVPPGMALQFKNVSKNDSMLLRNYVKKAIAGDILDTQEEAVIKK